MKSKLFLLMTICLVGATSYSAIPGGRPVYKFQDMYVKALNNKLSINERWQSLLQAAEVANADELMKIKRFAKSKDWFMRNASLVAFDKIGNDMVFDQAKTLVSDKSLVVRSAAVDVLTRRKNDETRRLLSVELGKSYNFHKAKSLWIRPQIMKYLSSEPQASDRTFFVKYLYDKDLEVAHMSAAALEKITNVRFSGKNSSAVISQWKKYAQTQKW